MHQSSVWPCAGKAKHASVGVEAGVRRRMRGRRLRLCQAPSGRVGKRASAWSKRKTAKESSAEGWRRVRMCGFLGGINEPGERRAARQDPFKASVLVAS